MTTLVVRGGRVLRPGGAVTEADVRIDVEDGTILAIGPDLEGDRSLDASDGLVMPGLVNGHCHVAMTLLRGYADDKPLEAWLQEDIWPVEAALTPDDVEAGATLGILEMIRGGVTAFADMYFHVDAVADAVERSGVRAVLGHGVIGVGKDESAAREDAREGLAVAERLDGRAEGRISTAFMPHSLTTVPAWLYEEFVPQARSAGLPVHIHANETRDEVVPIRDEHGVDPLVYAADLGLCEPEDWLAHAVHCTEAEIEVLADSGCGVVHCPASNMKLASGMAPVQALLDAGVTVGVGTDGAASNNDLSMFDELRDAAMVGKLAAGDAGAVPAGAAVSMATAGSAAAIGLEAGRLEVGAPADLAVVDLSAPHLTPVHDIESLLTYAASAADVRHTVCDGQILMEERTVRTLDASAVRERAVDQATSLLDRAN